MKLIRSQDRTEKYKKLVVDQWKDPYERNIWRTVHQAGSEELNIEVAKWDMDLFLEPTEEKVEMYRNKIHYETKTVPTFTDDFWKHKPIKDYLGDLSTCIALDYGCGSLIRYTTELAKRFSWVMGVDVNTQALEYAKKYILPNIYLEVVNGIDLRLFAEGSYNFVFSNLVFQHCGSKEILYDITREIFRILKVGGVVRLSYWTEEKDDDHLDAYHGTGFSVEGYKEMFNEIGFKIETITHQAPLFWITAVK